MANILNIIAGQLIKIKTLNLFAVALQQPFTLSISAEMYSSTATT